MRKFIKPSRREKFIEKLREANDALDRLSPKDVRDVYKGLPFDRSNVLSPE